MNYLRLVMGAAVVCLLGILLAACSTVGSLRIEPVKTDVKAVAPKFDRGVYRVDRDRTLYFVLRKQGVDPQTKKPVDQVVLLRVFWEPWGGITSLNPASLNATFRYLVMTPDAVGLYEGAGFVRMHNNYGSKMMSAWVVDGDMRLTESTGGFNDALGRSRFTGSFSASLSDVQTIDQTLGAQRDFFTRSLAISKIPTTQPTTAPSPATMPATLP